MLAVRNATLPSMRILPSERGGQLPAQALRGHTRLTLTDEAETRNTSIDDLPRGKDQAEPILPPAHESSQAAAVAQVGPSWRFNQSQ